jgi:peptide deformylase
MILPVYCVPQPILTQPAQPVTSVTPELRQLAADMRETMHNAQGIGLAAPQVGRSLSLLVAEYIDAEDPEHFPFLAFVNPRITWRSRMTTVIDEGCLSVPGSEGPVRRPVKIRVKAINLDNQPVEVKAKGLLARVLQHEIDHLEGKLFTELVEPGQMKRKPLIDYPRF